MFSNVKCLAVVLVLCVQACFGQSPMGNMMFPGQPPIGGGAGGGAVPMPLGGMFSNPLLMSMAMGGLDFNKLMYMSMLNGMGAGSGGGLSGMGSMLPAFGLYHAFN